MEPLPPIMGECPRRKMRLELSPPCEAIARRQPSKSQEEVGSQEPDSADTQLMRLPSLQACDK